MGTPASLDWGGVLGDRHIDDAMQAFSFGQTVAKLRADILSDSNLQQAWNLAGSEQYMPPVLGEAGYLEREAAWNSLTGAMLDLQTRVNNLGGGPVGEPAQQALLWGALNHDVSRLTVLDALGGNSVPSVGRIAQQASPDLWRQYGQPLLEGSLSVPEQLSQTQDLFKQLLNSFPSSQIPPAVLSSPTWTSGHAAAVPYSQITWGELPRWSWANPLFPAIPVIGEQFPIWPTGEDQSLADRPTIYNASAVSQYASSFVNGRTPYSHGLTRAGTDCSGLVNIISRRFGVNPGRTTWNQWDSAAGQHLGRDWTKWPPDVAVYFHIPGEGTNGANHAGFYIGNGIMVMETKPGTVCSYQHITDPYWQQTLMGAVKFIDTK